MSLPALTDDEIALTLSLILERLQVFILEIMFYGAAI